jgi:protein involved in polysaccharide export with SLBB domain
MWRSAAVLSGVLFLMGLTFFAFGQRPERPPLGEAPKAEPRQQEPVRIQPGDVLRITAPDGLPNQPISGAFRVEPEGTVSLGGDYGRARVANLTVAEAEVAIRQHLAAILKDPRVSVSWLSRPYPATITEREPLPFRIRPGLALDLRFRTRLPTGPMDGTYTVEPGGTLPLGLGFGRIAVAGMTLEEAEAALTRHLAKELKSPEVSVTLAGAIRPLGSSDFGEIERRLRLLEIERSRPPEK